MPGRVDRLLIDQDGVDHPAHLDQLLPVSAIASEARDLARADGADFAKAYFRDHSLEASALDAARRRTAEIVINDLDLRPAKLHQPASHGVLQRTALAVVQNLMGRRLSHIEQRLALQVMGADLVRDHGRPPSLIRFCFPEGAPGSTAPSGWSAWSASPPAVLATSAQSPRRSAVRRRTGRSAAVVRLGLPRVIFGVPSCRLTAALASMLT